MTSLATRHRDQMQGLAKLHERLSEPTPTQAIDEYKTAYIEFFGHPYPLISRGSSGGVILTLIDGEKLHWSMMELRMMTRFYRDMKGAVA